jgi:tetratricopeptide (TPR) repeat protein
MAAARAGTADELALRAAIAFANKDTAGMDAALASLAKVDPRSALGLRRVGEQSSREYRFDDAAGFARRATALDPDDPNAFFDLGLYLMRAGDEAAARTALEKSWSLDDSNRASKNMLDLLDKINGMENRTVGRSDFQIRPQGGGGTQDVRAAAGRRGDGNVRRAISVQTAGPNPGRSVSAPRFIRRPDDGVSGPRRCPRRLLRPRRRHGFPGGSGCGPVQLASDALA